MKELKAVFVNFSDKTITAMDIEGNCHDYPVSSDFIQIHLYPKEVLESFPEKTGLQISYPKRF